MFKSIFHIHSHKKGEIATFFLVLSILTVVAGAIIGRGQRSASQTTNTQAQSATSCEYITVGSEIAGVRWTANGSTYEEYHRCQMTGGGTQAVSLLTQYRCEDGRRIIDNNYNCAPGSCGAVTSGNISYGRCSTTSQNIPTVPVYPPNQPTPTASYPNQPGLNLPDRIESVRQWPSENNVVKLSNGNYQAAFSINFCRGTNVTGSSNNTELKYWIDDVPPGLPKIVKSSSTPMWNWLSPLSSNQCHSEAVSLELQGITDQMLCDGTVMLRAHTWYNRGGAAGLAIHPRGFKIPPQAQFCTPTTTLTPSLSTAPTCHYRSSGTVKLNGVEATMNNPAIAGTSWVHFNAQGQNVNSGTKVIAPKYSWTTESGPESNGSLSRLRKGSSEYDVAGGYATITLGTLPAGYQLQGWTCTGAGCRQTNGTSSQITINFECNAEAHYVYNVVGETACSYKSTARLYEWFDDNNDNSIQESEKRRVSNWPQAGSAKDLNNPIYDAFTIRAAHQNSQNETVWAVNRSVGGYDNDTIPKMVFELSPPATLKSLNYFPRQTISPTAGPTPIGFTQSTMIPPQRHPVVDIENGYALIEQLIPDNYQFIRTECKNIRGNICTQPASSQLNQVVYGQENLAKLKFECGGEVEYAFVVKKTITPPTSTPTNRPQPTATSQPSPTSTPRPAATATRTPQRSQNSFQIDVHPQNYRNDNTLQCWTLWNDNNDRNIRGNAPESGVNCSGSAKVNASSSELVVRLEITQRGVNNRVFEWQTNFCNEITRDCRDRLDSGYAATLSTGGVLECRWTDLANGGSTVSCTVVRPGQANASSRTGGQNPFLRRVDLNNDGIVGVGDFFSWIGSARSGRRDQCDLNGDGLCNMIDASFFLNPQFMGQTVN